VSSTLIAALRPVVLAHQGGWDEMLMVLVPILVIVALLRLAKRRVDRRGDEAAGPTPSAQERPPSSS
jgi:hypothetical protein